MKEWFEIFKTGTHTDSGGNTREWTEADLDSIAATYDPSVYEAPLVIGHPELNAPAYGWIESLRRIGSTLFAKAKQIAPEFAELVRAGSYKKISIALTPDNKLRHVGFLGAAAPAVEGLKDAEFSTMPEAMCYEFSDTDFPRFPEPMEIPIRQLQETLERLQQLESKLSSLTLMPAPSAPPVKDPALPDPALQFCTMAEHKAAAGFLTPAQKQLLIAVATGTGTEGEAQTFARSETLTLLTRFVDLLPRQISAERFPAVRQQKSPAASGAIEQLRKIFAAQSGIV